MRILSAESLRFPEEGSSAQGKPGPKLRSKGVGDGKSVKIPMPPPYRYERWGDAGGYASLATVCQVEALRRIV